MKKSIFLISLLVFIIGLGVPSWGMANEYKNAEFTGLDKTKEDYALAIYLDCLEHHEDGAVAT